MTGEEETQRDQALGRWTTTTTAEEIQQPGRQPASEREIGEQRMQRVAEPLAAQPRRTRRRHRRARHAQPVDHRIESGVAEADDGRCNQWVRRRAVGRRLCARHLLAGGRRSFG